MGCTPSQSTNCILVEQQQASRGTNIEEKTSFRKPENSSTSDSPFKKPFFLEEEEADCMSDSFLQESMKSSTSQHSSKSSSSSWDSGVYELEEDYSHVITENSDPKKVREIDTKFTPPPEDLELFVEGKACPKRVSARNRQQLEQQAILEVLKAEGLIVRSPSKANGGLRFEFVSTEYSPVTESSLTDKLPPLIRNKQKQKRKDLTYEEIQQKLIKAEERRMKMTEEKLNKMSTKDRMEIQTMAQKQAELNRQKLEKKLQDMAQSREKYLKEMQERLNAQKEHAQKVRERKQMLANGFKYVLPVESEH